MTKIKFFLESKKGKDILIIIILILVGLASFELGRLSKQSSNNGLKIEYKGQEANIINSLSYNDNPNLSQNIDTGNTTKISGENNYFASRLGRKFYSKTCSAGKTIKEGNKIYFSSVEEAMKAGFELSSSCR